MFGISKLGCPHPAGGGCSRPFLVPGFFKPVSMGVLVIMYFLSKDNKNIKEKGNVDVLSQVTGAHLEAFWLVWLVWRGWTKCHNGQNQGLMMGLTDTWISWACALT